MAAITGWGRNTWSSGTWGQAFPVSVTGIAGTGAVGSVTVLINIDVSVTGVAGTGAVGSVTVVEGTGVTVSATGVAGTGAVLLAA